MKKLFTIVGAMLIAISLNAQSLTTLKIGEFSIEPGETKTVTLDLDNPDFVVSGFSCGILLPEGLDIAKNKKGKYNITINTKEERSDDHTVTSELHPDGTVTMVYVSLSAAEIWGTEGPVLDIPFVASETASGIVDVKVTKQDITSSQGVHVKPADYSVKVTIGTTGIKDVSGNGAFTGDGKFVKKGQIVIRKGGKEYNAIGSKIK